MKKSKIKLLLMVVTSVLLMIACADNGNTEGSDEALGSEETLSVGILQFMEHNSLQSAQDGFLAHLEENGYIEGENLEVETLNAQGDQANLQQMSEQLASNNDLLLAIATPAAQSMLTVESEKPVIFTAVTDPVDSGIVESMEEPGRNASGTSDLMPVDAQVELLLSIDSEAENVGVVYNSSEQNSEIQANQAIEAIEEAGKNAEVSTVTNTNDVQQVVTSLMNDIELLYIPTDNTLAATAPTVGQLAIENEVPVVAGAIDMVLEGGLATYGIDYESLGEQTGSLALEVINGSDPAATPVQTAEQFELVVNEEMADALGISPDEIRAPE